MGEMTRGQYADAGTSLEFKTGNWRSTIRPVHIHSKAPCHAECPAGEDQQAWFALLQEQKVELGFNFDLTEMRERLRGKIKGSEWKFLKVDQLIKKEN